jgi:uncharacterized protein (DUF433 family)
MTLEDIKINLHNLIENSKDKKLLELFYNQFKEQTGLYDKKKSGGKDNSYRSEMVMDKAITYLSTNKLSDKRYSRVINIDKEILHGTPVFKGTRVPVKNLFDYLEGGESIETFLTDFPRVKKKQIENVLKIARELLIEKRINENIS